MPFTTNLPPENTDPWYAPITASWAALTTFINGLETSIASKVSNTRTVNGHALSSDVTVSAADVGAVPTTRTVNGHALSGDVTVTAADVSAVPTTRTVNGQALSSDVTLVKGDVGLGNVDNTSDASKPVSTAQQTALNLKAPLSSPALTGTPTAPTASGGTNSTQIATTAFVQSLVTTVAVEVLWNGSTWGTYDTNPARVRNFRSQDDVAATAPTYYNVKDLWFAHPDAT